MERSEILTTMAELKLYGMKAAYDEIIGTAVKRRHKPTRIVGDLLTAEISENEARSIRYQITIANLTIRRSTRPWRAIWQAASSWRTGATSCWSAAPAPARPTSPAAGSSTSSTW